LLPVRFGEDRKSLGSPLGMLRFGARKDVARFKENRVYF
jgi:hypothetical protein